MSKIYLPKSLLSLQKLVIKLIVKKKNEKQKLDIVHLSFLEKKEKKSCLQ